MPLYRGTRLALLGGGQSYIDKVLSYGPLAYWPMYEPSGSISICLVRAAQNGAYTGVTLGELGIGDKNTCPFFDGSNDVNNVYSTTLRDAFPGAEGTLALWAKVYDSGVWTDGTHRYPTIFLVDGSNHLYFRKNLANNQLVAAYVAGGTSLSWTHSSQSDTTWVHWALTWSKASDQLKCYKAGSQIGATLTGLGVWAGSLVSTDAVIGARDTSPQKIFHGWLAHCALFNSALSEASILDLATV